MSKTQLTTCNGCGKKEEINFPDHRISTIVFNQIRGDEFGGDVLKKSPEPERQTWFTVTKSPETVQISVLTAKAQREAEEFEEHFCPSCYTAMRDYIGRYVAKEKTA